MPFHNTIEQPVVTKDADKTLFEEVETHPAYAQISVSRVSGAAHLYGSDFQHASYVSIKLQRSQLHRSLSRDWAFGREQIVELAMSEAQWATFVSSFNMGAGVQCTLQWTQDQGYVPGLPQPNRTAKFSDEFKQDLDDIENCLKDLLRDVKDGTSGMPKGKAQALTGKIENALKTVQSSLPFVNEQFGEHVEETVEKAKAEIHGYLGGQIQRAGLTALGATPNDVLKLEGTDVPKN